MANTKTAKKQVLINERNHARNLHYKTRMKNVVKKVRAILANPNIPVEDAQKALIEAQRVISQTSSKGIIHKNTASRKISRLALLLKKTHMPEPVVIEENIEAVAPIEHVAIIAVEDAPTEVSEAENVEEVAKTEATEAIEVELEVEQEVEHIEESEPESIINEFMEPVLDSSIPEASDFDTTVEVADEASLESEPAFTDSDSDIDKENK